MFDKKPSMVSDLVFFSDPPVWIGNDRILNEYKKEENELQLQISAQQDFDITETLITMEKQLSAAIEKGSQILQAAKGLNFSDK